MSYRPNARLIAATFLAATRLLAVDTETDDRGRPVASRQVILQLNSTPIATLLQQIGQLADADEVRTLNSRINLVLLHSRSGNVTALTNILKKLPFVSLVEPDFILKSKTTPNDPSFSQQWALFNPTTPGADIGVTQAWNVSTGSASVAVGVLDTGIDYTHPDLAPNVWSAPSSFTVNLSFGPLTCPAGSHGFNAITRSCDPMDDNNHGTHVSGIIGAAGNNGVGVSGVNWSTSLMSLKFLDSTGVGPTSSAIDSIEFAMQAKRIFGAGANVRVLSASWSGSGYSQALLNEINSANASDILFVAAAGNESANNDSTPSYPASYPAPNLIAVAATTSTDALASYSNYGPNSVQIAAPGSSILSTIRGGGYAYLTGTSMATPHVSGAAALVLAGCSLNTAALRNTLLSNVDLLPALTGMVSSGGRLNVDRAIRNCGAAAAPALSGVQLIPPQTVGGAATAQNQVVLTAAAPQGGITVQLSSSNPALASVPATVVVPAGATTATFTIQTSAVATATPVTISAFYLGVTRTGTLTLNPLAVASVGITPGSVTGGGGATGTVTLTGQAGAGGAAVALSSNNAAATVPASVTVPAGSTSATFAISTTTVTAAATVTITASYGGSTAPAVLTVNPPGPALVFSLSPTTVVAGATSAATVTLASPAPTGGAIVALSSSHTSAAMPATVTVPTGSTSVVFPVSTFSVGAVTQATLTAAYNGSTASAVLTINPLTAALSLLSVSPASVTGGSAATGTVTLTSAAPAGGAVVSVSSNNAAVTTPASVFVPAGSTSMSFSMSTSAVSTATAVTITAGYNGVTVTAGLSVNPASPVALAAVTVNPATLTGGAPATGTVTLSSVAPAGGVTVGLSSNSPAATVPLSVIVPAGSSSANFSISTGTVGTATPVTITASFGGSTRTASLSVNPAAGGVASVSLSPATVVSGASSAGTVTLSAPAPAGGAVVALSVNSAISWVPASVTVPAGSTSAVFGIATFGATATTTVTVSASYSGSTVSATLTVLH